jgi:GNAT superfamily N-acetyltransferase
MTSAMIDVVPIGEVAPADVLRVINSAFERHHGDLDWFTWKHVEGPWGNSIGWAAVRDGAVVGVRLFVPWRSRWHDSEIEVLRAMDGAVHPDAQRQGLFSRLVVAEMDRLRAERREITVFSTSVPASRDAYRKLGWNTFEVSHAVGLPRATGAKVVVHEWPDIAEFADTGETGFRTAWTTAALRWRTDPRSGRRYECLSLMQASGPNGVVFRRVGGGTFPSANICLVWGSDAERRVLVAAVARRARTPLVRFVVSGRSAGICVRRHGSSTVSWWSAHASSDDDRTDVDAWTLSYADLEGVL